MEHRAGSSFAHDLGHVGERLDRADLVVGEHHRHERHRVVERRRQCGEIDDAVAIDVDDAAADTVHGIEHGVVLDGGADDRAAVGAPEDRRVVGFGATAGEHDLARPATERLGHDDPDVVDRVTGRTGHRVGAGRIAIRLGEVREHRLDRFRTHGRARRMVEIDDRRRVHRCQARD